MRAWPGRRRLAAGLLAIVLPGVAAAAATDLEPLPGIPRDNMPEEARQQLDALEAEVDASLGADPVDPVGLAAAFGEIGGFYFLYDFLDAAEIAWSNASRLQPEEFRWHYLLGAMLRLEGDFPAAVSELERALSIRPSDVPSHIRLGRIFIDQGDLEAARGHFERALELRPGAPAAHYGLGRIAIVETRYQDALTHLRAALPTQPEGSTVHHQLGLAYRGLGDLDNARLHLGKNRGVRVGFSDPLVEGLVGLAEGPRAKARSGIQAQRGGRLNLAAELLAEAARLDPEDAWIRYNLGVVHQEMGDAAGARREFEEAVRLDPEYRNAQYNLAQLLVDEGDLSGAVSHFARAREIDPEDHVAWLDMAVALSRMGESERARSELEALVEAAPTLVEAKLNLATLLAQLGRDAEAMERVEEILAGDATHEELASAELLAGRLLEARDPGAALERFRAAVDLDGSSSEARLDLAMALGRQGRFAAAAAQFAELVEMRPEDAQLRVGQSMALLLGEEYEEALAALEAATTSLPGAIGLRHNLARLLAACPDDSVRDGARALDLARSVLEAEQSIDHAETLAMALAEVGRLADAVALQQQVVEQRRLQGAPPQSIALSSRFLETYRQGRAVRAPWLGGR